MFSVSPAIAWLIAGIAVLGAEIFLGTAYLLVVAFAFGATAAGAAVGLDFTMQLVVCAAVLAGGCLSVIAVRRRNAGRKDPSAKLQHLDSGQWVTVDVVGSDGLAVVQYRGARGLPGQREMSRLRLAAGLSPESTARSSCSAAVSKTDFDIFSAHRWEQSHAH